MIKVVGVRFKTGGKVYFFDPQDFDIKKGDHVIVDTARGLECGLCVQGVHTESEDKIMKVVQELAKEKLVILISHRLANVVKADNIYVVKAGEIVETGNHAELLERGGDYSKLFLAQQELEKYAKED